jgi:hypothetical protein
MSQMGQSRRFRARWLRSALPPIATDERISANDRKVPTADIAAGRLASERMGKVRVQDTTGLYADTTPMHTRAPWRELFDVVCGSVIFRCA